MDAKITITQAFNEIGNKDGFDRVTIDKIVKKCHISRTSFYYHFKDLPDVINYYLEKKIVAILMEGVKRNEGDTKAALECFMENVVYHFPECRKLLNSKWRVWTENCLYRIWITVEEKLFDMNQNETPITSEEKKFLTRFVAGGVCHYIIYEEYQSISVSVFVERLYYLLCVRYDAMKGKIKSL